MGSDSNGGLPDGARVLHVFFDVVPHSDLLATAIQIETVGVKRTAAPYVLLTPTENRKLFALFRQLPGCFGNEEHLTIPLDAEGE